MEETLEQRRYKYGVILSLNEFRDSYNSGAGVCRGCRAVHYRVSPNAKGLVCNHCGTRRVFGPVQYVWNGWIAELPAGRWRRPIEELLTGGTDGDYRTKVVQGVDATS